MRTFADQVAETENPRDVTPFDITEDRVKRREIAMQIGNERNSIHRKRLQERGSTSPHGTHRYDYAFCRYCTMTAQAVASYQRQQRSASPQFGHHGDPTNRTRMLCISSTLISIWSTPVPYSVPVG